MTGIEITAIVESTLQLIAKLAGLAQAAAKGDVAAAEALKSITANDAAMKAVVDKAHAYLDEKFRDVQDGDK